MPYLKNYLDKIIERGNAGLAESISNTAEEVGNNYLRNFSFTSHEIGLLLGNVQSGKTGQMFIWECQLKKKTAAENLENLYYAITK